MTNEEIKREVLLRVRRLKEKKAKRNKRLAVGGIGLACLALSALLLPSLFAPPVAPPATDRTQTTDTAPTRTQTTAHAATQTTTVPSSTATTQTDTKHSYKGPSSPTATAGVPRPDSTLVRKDGTLYRPATEEDRLRYGLPPKIATEDLGEPLGRVGTHADAPLYSDDPALEGWTAYTYAPAADGEVLVVLCGEEEYVFVRI